MTKSTREPAIALIIVVVTSLFCAACQRASQSAQELKPRSSAIQVGDIAPNFSLRDQNNQTVNLSSARGNTPVVLVFYRGYW